MSETNPAPEPHPLGETNPAPEPHPIADAEPDPERKQRATSDVGLLLSIGLAAPIYGLLILGAYAMPDALKAMLLERGWIPHVIMVLTALSVAILIVKVIRLRRQRRVFNYSILETERITPANVGDVIGRVESLREQAGPRLSSVLLERVNRLLEHYAARGDVAETANVNSTDADSDASAVAASFSIVKVFIWAIPIVGFIGTVIGIGVAVGGFSASLEGAEQLDTIKSSLGEVTSGLAIAFDTTLVALVASILVMFPTSAIQKAEDRLVNDVDDFCVSEVLRRLTSPEQEVEAADERPVFDPEALRAAIVQAIAAPISQVMDAHARLMSRMRNDHSALATAQTTLEGVQGTIAGQMAQFSAAANSLGPSVQRAVAQLERSTALAERSTTTVAATQEQLCAELGASRQLLSILAAGMKHAPAPAINPGGSNGVGPAGVGGNGSNGQR